MNGRVWSALPVRFDSKGGIVNYADDGTIASWEDVVASAAKIVSFIDLAGHEKYLKTTVCWIVSFF
jgi:GTPase